MDLSQVPKAMVGRDAMDDEDRGAYRSMSVQGDFCAVRRGDVDVRCASTMIGREADWGLAAKQNDEKKIHR